MCQWNITHASALKKRVTEVEEDYLAYWLNKFISCGSITRQHLIYQNMDAFMTKQLTQPNPVTNWEHWPTLFSYCESLAEVATRKGDMFCLGGKRFGLKDHRHSCTNTFILQTWTIVIHLGFTSACTSEQFWSISEKFDVTVNTLRYSWWCAMYYSSGIKEVFGCYSLWWDAFEHWHLSKARKW